MKPQTIITLLIGILLAIITPAVGWLVSEALDRKVESAVIVHKLSELQKDRDIDVEQNRRLGELKETDGKFWKLHAAEKKEIDKMRVAMGLPLMDWPTFDAHAHK